MGAVDPSELTMEKKFSRCFHECRERTIRTLVEEVGTVDGRQLKVGDFCNEPIERIWSANVDNALSAYVSVRTCRHEDRDHWTVLAVAVIALKVASVRGSLVEVGL